jgi:F-type H+-transporting ATPase subunit a
MVGDHKVLAVFVGFGYVLVPLPVMFLGLIVCIVQTVVFCILSVVYIGMAIEDLSHDHH